MTNEEIFGKEKSDESLTETHTRIYSAAAATITALGKEVRQRNVQVEGRQKRETMLTWETMPTWEKRISQKVRRNYKPI